MSETNLDDILKGEETEAATPEPEQTKDAEAPAEAEASEATEAGTEAATGETEAGDEPAKDDATPASEENQQVPLQALREERRKRQELERRWQEYQEHLRQQQAQSQEEQPDWYEEPDKAASTLDKRLRSELDQRLWNERLNMSEMMARQQYGSEAIDKDVEKFQELVQQRPYLAQELQNHAHPYDFVHQTVEKERTLEEIGDPQSYREKLLNDPEFLKEVQKRIGQPAQSGQGQKPQKPSAPPSLANETSAAPRASDGPPTHRSLDDILGN